MRYVIITLTTIIAVAIFGSGLVTGLLVAMKLDQTPPPLVSTVTYPTGQQVLDELQKYRVSQGLPEFELSEPLCNNIAARWQNYQKTNSHEGLKDFLIENHPSGLSVSEILVSGSTAKDMVDQWASSPSHNLYIHRNSKICVYSAEGSTVALLSN